MKKWMLRTACLMIFAGTSLVANGREVLPFNNDWQFKNQEDFQPNEINGSDVPFSILFKDWSTVTLPHTAKLEPLVVTNAWSGISWYKKDFTADPAWKGRCVRITFDGVMQEATVWLNHKKLIVHQGGYLPFTMDISDYLVFGAENRLIVRTDNRDNAEIPPGKPIKTLDFCYYSGIYRKVFLTVSDPIHITDAIEENQPASGGIRVWYPEVSKESALVTTAVHVRNDRKKTANIQIACKIRNKSGKVVASVVSAKLEINASRASQITQQLKVIKPALWHPDDPNLYTLEVNILENNQVIDQQLLKIGIRKFSILNERLQINDRPFLMCGTNRHQEYPYLGNALSDNAQFRDAYLIKKAGFNVVRLSHYPQADAFMNACDELGILTITAIPGWQFFGDSIFVRNAYQNARELIRKERNHPSVVFWELSLNESTMPNYFMEGMNRIAQEESPESKLLTTGWINRFYDVWIPARQHAKAPNYWKNYKGTMPLFTGEYGDWEYFAQDAGLNQADYANLKSDERTSRQLRGDGERRLLQQALNYQEAHNDNLRNPHLGDANWLMFDYNRGYSPIIESSGVADIFRIPKFAFYFYQSQQLPSATVKPMVKIASYWNEQTNPKTIKVFSNCDVVSLFLNDQLIEKKSSVRDINSDHLIAPPFVFSLKGFEPGVLKAVGFLKGKPVVSDVVTTAAQPTQIKLSAAYDGKSLKADGADVLFVHATVCDINGHPVYQSDAGVQFELEGDGKLIGSNPIKAEAGIATILVQAGNKAGTLYLKASSTHLKTAKLIIKTKP
ncbi:MAG TPA: glycoside hydrolase family 2 TIM barrel-domain containing protein [Bacteroidales bacterium]|nr:glycoside hydrolase family 2 TIM barrel-domain containing protein [Bacteroidales bacterium]